MSLESMLARALNSGRKPSTPRPSGLYLGTCQALIGGERRPFSIPWKPPQHTFLVGRTGAGKTTAVTRIQAEHLKAGLPFLNNDHHGATTGELLGLVEAAGAQCVLQDPAADSVTGWNPLDTAGDSAYPMVRELVAIFHHRLWPDAWGPRLEELLRMTLLALAEAKLTLLEATAFLSRPEFRRAVLRHVTIPEVREFWALRFERLSPSQRSLISETVLNKVSLFNDPVLRYMVGQQQSTLDFDEALAKGHNLFNNFSSGHLGGNDFLAAALLMPTFKNAVYRRPPGARPYSVFLDEFQEMVAVEFLDDYLRSFRKFGCSVYLATQHLNLAPALKAAIFGNCTRFICFATSATDAVFLGREFGGPEGALITDMLPELKTGRAIVKVRGEPARLLRVDPVVPPSKELISRGRAGCLHLGKSRAEIDAEIEQRRQRFMPGNDAASREKRDARLDDGTIDLAEGYEGY